MHHEFMETCSDDDITMTLVTCVWLVRENDIRRYVGGINGFQVIQKTVISIVYLNYHLNLSNKDITGFLAIPLKKRSTMILSGGYFIC